MRVAMLLVLILACTRPAARDAAWERHAAALAGHWTVRFDYASGESARGSMELTANRTLNRTHARVGLPTDYGTYDVLFPGLGGPPSGGRVPAVVVGVAGDSMFVFFESERDGFSMQMRGVVAADSMRGTWAAGQTRGTIASGTFLMTRQ